jgi:serine/threonine protein kinase
MHSLGVIHGDLKAVSILLSIDICPNTYRRVLCGQANILVDGNHRARLADFGVATVLYNSPTAATTTCGGGVCGTMRWMSPELLDVPEGVAGPKPSVLSDTYALAMTVWEVGASDIRCSSSHSSSSAFYRPKAVFSYPERHVRTFEGSPR